MAGGEVSGDVNSSTSRVLTLPASTVLAYQVLELAVDNQGQCLPVGKRFGVLI